MTEEELRFLEYRNYINDCVKQVQTEMALGNVRSEESLRQNIERVSEFIVSVEAFAFFSNSAPYEWYEFVTPDLMKTHEHDLVAVVLAVVNWVVSQDTYSQISRTDGYRYLTEGRRTKKIRCKIDGEDRRITLREVWKVRCSLYDHLAPYRIDSYKGRTLAVYRREGGDDGEVSFTVLLEHKDPCLVWKSKRQYEESKPLENSAEYYEEQKCEVLLHHGADAGSLWLTEVQTTEQFYEHFCTETESEDDFYGLGEYEFVVYHHESGNVHVHAGFNDDEDFDQACKTVAEYLKK